MIANYYSFTNKVDEPQPLIKNPGDVDGQSFDIGDCRNSTLVVMDNCEQVQVDQCTDCRIFIGACASSIFIRNCTNCTFYLCCRQLRLRDVSNSIFYVHSMSEVHIEDTEKVLFAPFNGGYKEHSQHLKNANIDIKQNLWYDIFDHNDPNKTRKNWGLLNESKYEKPWYPHGESCDIAVVKTEVGSLQKVQDTNMQSFDIPKTKSLPSETTSQPPAAPAVAPVTKSANDDVIFVKMVNRTDI